MTALGAVLLLASLAGAAEPPVPRIPFETLTLDNGLRAILSQDKSVPVVTVAWMIPAGARQEGRGRSGFAHLFEHLMFEGSAHAPKGQFDKILEANGADNNASTHEDFTFFYEELPANALPVALWLDADRLEALAITETSMRNQIDVVKEEKRQSFDNKAYAPLLGVEIASRSFSNWANAHPVIGSFEDLDAATLADVREFFQRHYSPNNAWMAVVGDFDPPAARAAIRRYFSALPKRPAPPAVDTAEPPQPGPRNFTFTDAHAKAPGVALAWTGMPARRSPDFYALAVLGRLLFEGESSRLYQRLVKDAQAATSIDEGGTGGLGFPVCDASEYRAPGLFGGFIVHKSSVSAARVRGLVLAELKRVAAEGVSEAELSRARTKLRSEWILERQTTLGKAEALLRAAVLDGDPAAANGELERYLAVGSEEIKSASAKYLGEGSLNTFELKAGAP